MKQKDVHAREHLTRTESKCRAKVIQEYHLNKQEQRIFDNAKVKMGLRYKTIYRDLRNDKDFTFMLEIKGRRISAASAKAGNAFEKQGNTFKEAAIASAVISAVKNIYGFMM